ncbi:hypothetical protein AB0L59_12670 [Streptomyces sp. NPDC052109]|uniref:hypothetical protein n=1 Tax=Streptomyces sp. NPDC052109 TaxID=3155527 RepID=UPI0034333886
MSESEGRKGHGAGLRRIAARWARHHREAVARREEEELDRDADNAKFDLGADIAHPTSGHSPAGFDVEADIGQDKEPPELRG